MKTPRQSSQPAWQIERVTVLHRACRSIQGAVERGQPVGRAIHRTAKRLAGRPFRCEPSRRLALSAKTLRRHWDAWRHGGRVPSALRLNFYHHRRLYAPALVRFVNRCAKHGFRTYKAAWQAFCAQGYRGASINYDTLHRALPPGCFKAFQAQWKAIRRAQIAIARAKMKFTAEIRSTVPAHPPRRRVKRAADFQI